jgi:hypothetical protein
MRTVEDEELDTLRADEVAEILKVRTSRIYEMARQKDRFFGIGSGVVVHVGQRQLRFNRAALRSWIERGGAVAVDGGANEEAGGHDK